MSEFLTTLVEKLNERLQAMDEDFAIKMPEQDDLSGASELESDLLDILVEAIEPKLDPNTEWRPEVPKSPLSSWYWAGKTAFILSFGEQSFAQFGKALEDVNHVRMALAIGEGKLPELPQGIKSDVRHCVLARALSNGWTPHVGTAESKIIHHVDSEAGHDFNLEAIEQTLSKRFNGVEVIEETADEHWDIDGPFTDYDGVLGSPVIPDERYIVVSFINTPAMKDVITWFDAGDTPWLEEELQTGNA